MDCLLLLDCFCCWIVVVVGVVFADALLLLRRDRDVVVSKALTETAVKITGPVPYHHHST